MCEVGNDFILCRCATGEIDISKPYWKLFKLDKKSLESAQETKDYKTLAQSTMLSLEDCFPVLDDDIMEVGDIIVPAIMYSPTYQSFADMLNSRQCFDTPIEHSNMDRLVIHLHGDKYDYYFSDGKWLPNTPDMNPPLRTLKTIGEAKGIDNIPSFKENDLDLESYLVSDSDLDLDLGWLNEENKNDKPD